MTMPLPTEEADQFASGVLDCVRTLLAGLIGQGVIPPDSLQADFQRLAEFWREQRNHPRAEPAAYLLDALKNMERLMGEVNADIAAGKAARNNIWN
jgi:hypothetical protein